MDFATLARPSGALQQPPDQAAVSALCTHLLPDGPRVESAREIGGGLFNNTFVLACSDGKRRVLRISPDHDDPALFSNEAFLLRREVALGPVLEPVLATLLPRVLAVDFSGDIVSRDAVLTEFIDGENWDAVKDTLSPAQNDSVWRELGGLVRRIHEVRGRRFGWPEPEVPATTWSGFILHAARGLLLDFGRLRVDDTETREWLKAIEDGRPLLDEMREPRLVHGDPWPKNVLIQREGGTVRIAGLLDHERGLWGDPMNEWVFHLLKFPPAFWETYGPRPEGQGAEYRAHVYHGLILAQVILEARRYGRDDRPARHELARVTQEMRRLIVACGLS
jgi:aminoglycoside phosphotransferase (APT) family kinase protein